MFNKNFNLTDYIKDIPSLSIRKAVLGSLVGSLNWTICGAADGMSSRLIELGYDHNELKTLSKRDVTALLADSECGASRDEIEALRKLWLVRNEWSHLLARCTIVTTGTKAKKDGYGTLAGTLTNMTGPQRERVIDPRKLDEAEAAGIKYTPAEIKAAIAEQLRDDNFYAGLRAKRAGMTEWIIDQLFAQVTDNAETDHYSQLDADTKEVLCSKVSAAYNKMQAVVRKNVLFNKVRDDSLGLGDKLIIDALSAQLPKLIYVTKVQAVVDKAIKIKAKRVRKTKEPVVQRAPAPTQSNTVTTVEPNGFKVTRTRAPGRSPLLDPLIAKIKADRENENV